MKEMNEENECQYHQRLKIKETQIAGDREKRKQFNFPDITDFYDKKKANNNGKNKVNE